MKKDPLTLYGLSIAVIPEKGSSAQFKVFCTPISLTDGQKEPFTVLEDIKFVQPFNITDFACATACFTRVVKLIEHMNGLQEKSCKTYGVPCRPLSLYVGQDSRRPVSVDALLLYFAGEIPGQANIYNYVLDDPNQPVLDFYAGDFKVKACGYVEELLGTLTTQTEKQQVCKALIDLFMPVRTMLSELSYIPSYAALYRRMNRDITPGDLSDPEVIRYLANFIAHPRDDHMFPGLEDFIHELKERLPFKDDHPFMTCHFKHTEYKKAFDDLSPIQKRMATDSVIDLFMNESRGFDEYMPLEMFEAISAAGVENAPFVVARDGFLSRYKHLLFERAAPGFHEACCTLGDLIEACSVSPGSYTPGGKIPEYEAVPSEMDGIIADLKEEWDRDGEGSHAHYELGMMARKLGEVFADKVNENGHVFWFTSPIKGYETSKYLQQEFPSYALPHWHTDFRDAFYQGYNDNMMRVLNRRVKLPLDESSAFFADPLADKMKDEMQVALGIMLDYKLEDMPELRRAVGAALKRLAKAFDCFERYEDDIASGRLTPEEIGQVFRQAPDDVNERIAALLVEKVTGRAPATKGRSAAEDN